jgi:hypothetical protein
MKPGQPRSPLTLTELDSRHRILFFYQHWCPGCHSRGFPTLLALIARTTPDDVGFAVGQTVFRGLDMTYGILGSVAELRVQFS